MDQAESDNVEASYTCLLKIGVYIMSKLYECSECGELFTKHEIDWEGSDESYESYYCHNCSRFLEQCGIDAMDPDGFGYDEYGNWDSERLGL